jgi:hypothetical protein
MAERGKVYKGQEFVADVEYDVLMWQSGNMKEGRLRISPPMGASVDRLTLHMSDGKKWNFYAAGNGEYRVTGDPY